MTRTKIATSHDAKYSYWLDTSDRYIYQWNEGRQSWVGWLCSQDAWERTFSLSCELGEYSEWSPAADKGAILKSRGWSIQIERIASGRFRMFGFAPDRAALEAQPRAIPNFACVCAEALA